MMFFSTLILIPESIETVCPQFPPQVKFVFIPYERHLQLPDCGVGVGWGVNHELFSTRTKLPRLKHPDMCPKEKSTVPVSCTESHASLYCAVFTQKHCLPLTFSFIT